MRHRTLAVESLIVLPEQTCQPLRRIMHGALADLRLFCIQLCVDYLSNGFKVPLREHTIQTSLYECHHRDPSPAKHYG